jgi:hypothetical protein
MVRTKQWANTCTQQSIRPVQTLVTASRDLGTSRTPQPLSLAPMRARGTAGQEWVYSRDVACRISDDCEEAFRRLGKLRHGSAGLVIAKNA